jgi:hypothetical protein
MNTKIKNIWEIIWQSLLLIIISAVLLELTLGIVFRIKDRKLINTEARDYPYLYFMLKQDDGYRNADGLKIFTSKEKPDSTYRIITSGGSVIYGQAPDKTIAANLEQILQDSFPNTKIEVLNAGIPAFVIEQEFILIQLLLQYYEPNLIVSLDGYNDLISCEINRYYKSPDLLSPHNWRDFRFVRQQEKKKKLYGRFYGVFPNIYRLYDFALRRSFDKKFNYSELSNQKEAIATTYTNRVADINAFCNAKGIAYHHFLQPIRFSKPENERERQLLKIYSCIDQNLAPLSYSSSLLGIFNSSNSIYIDECHVNPVGNQIFARNIANIIYPTINEAIQQTVCIDSLSDVNSFNNNR